jgi:transcriptional regulator with XRE-family HTH domain
MDSLPNVNGFGLQLGSYDPTIDVMGNESDISGSKNGSASAVGQRIRRLRQERGWSQAQLGQRLETHQKQVSSYERGVHVPSADLLIRIAEIFDVSLDYLLAGTVAASQRAEIADRDLVRQMELIDKLPPEDKTAIKAVLNSFIIKNRFQQLAQDV